jgi:hypothetical protein
MKSSSFPFTAVHFLAYKLAGFSETAGRTLDEFAFFFASFLKVGYVYSVSRNCLYSCSFGQNVNCMQTIPGEIFYLLPLLVP